jgi:hypothetical protein
MSVLMNILRSISCRWSHSLLLIIKLLVIMGFYNPILMMVSRLMLDWRVHIVRWRMLIFVTVLLFEQLFGISLLLFYKLVCADHVHKLFMGNLPLTFVRRTDYLFIDLMSFLIRIVKIVIMNIIVLMKLNWRVVLYIILIVYMFLFLFDGGISGERLMLMSWVWSHFYKIKVKSISDNDTSQKSIELLIIC